MCKFSECSQNQHQSVCCLSVVVSLCVYTCYLSVTFVDFMIVQVTSCKIYVVHSHIIFVYVCVSAEFLL